MNSQKSGTRPVSSHRTGPLTGTITVPGDKSMSHRALILGGSATGTTRVTGILEGEDVLCTAEAMRQLGARVEKQPDGSWAVTGRGVGALTEPDRVLDMGNSGTAARLLMGLVASAPFTTFFCGDASLHKRPMRRISDPIGQMGAVVTSRSGDRFPLAVTGRDLMPIRYELPVASAQVKSAILLAALNTPGTTTVVEPKPSRDHTENMLRHFGARVEVETDTGGGRIIRYDGQQELTAADVIVPADPSSAAFPAVAAAITPGSDIRITNVGMNPLRDGIFTTLRDMGATIDIENLRTEAGEPVADIRIQGGTLKGIEVPPERAVSMIDEYPILFVAAAFAEGTTIMRGLEELRVKESDRIAVMAEGLKACGVTCEELEDGLIIHSSGSTPPQGGATVATELDHRIAMSFLVLGMRTEHPVTVDDGRVMETSFPGFTRLMTDLGAKFTEEQAG
ncbi:3-phosphoshikimate 1-carboxyvinyltransferase [Sneathiella chinensis]|uniref:3-phosphoshikimate 1-carboxyvinyltransferase n=1 Tax=Sneathiella chinensis TaxID=349750 RepID=A0ABQ5U0W4_9PROT|nr:3-phosphoshikimate 1-carboxyvinyltransferase [Sneathiella chinensis]GLQ04977.1 3-phosphoshikimate 1-carboxyvinyltransferase [Sneathiella chinensis]